MKPRVAVVGLLRGQQRFVDEAIGGVLDIDYVPVQSRVRTRVQRVFMMRKFVNHATQNEIDREKLEYVNGGLSDLKRALLAYGSAAASPAGAGQVKNTLPSSLSR